MHKQLKGIGIKHIKPKVFQEKHQKTNRRPTRQSIENLRKSNENLSKATENLKKSKLEEIKRKLKEINEN